MMKDFRDRVAVVTGAASGIGLGIASSLVKRGVAVVMIDVEAATLEAAAAKLSADGAHVMPLLVDVSDRKAMYSAADQIRSEEHTSELQSLMRISYAVFCLTQKTNKEDTQTRMT